MDQELLSRDNQQRSEALQSRVSLLKSIAVDIEGETIDQNTLLDHADKEITSVQSFLSSGRKRAGQVLANAKRERKTMFAVAAGVTIFLYSCYFILTRTGGEGRL